ncbi:Fanconi anemia group G protein isoform X2 [Myripristis murdjan]|uniref:Fanconi anemia group G protein isoform X2 n=1 Tax=Myripristis murdjan TaxID=586833 RepID=UPI0011764754|nr:Fanconi anemia group G protein isoform X2 [Myripristis murdjan]
MQEPASLVDKWIQENNDLVNKWRQRERGAVLNQEQSQSSLRWCSAEFHKLLRKIQGVPAMVDHAQLELTVVYNACVFSLAQTQFSEVELLLTQAVERALEVTGNNPVASDPPVFWRAVLKSLGNSALKSCIVHLLCLQWAVWLSTCRLNTIQDLLEELSSLSDSLAAGGEDNRRSLEMKKPPEIQRVVMDPRNLHELLHICTVILQGAERLTEGRSSEALSVLQRASALPAPRALLAKTHLLSGFCLSHMDRPHMALQCYRNALEMDSRCVYALYQSVLIYRHLGNTQAEIQALRLLHSTLMLPLATEPNPVGAHPLSPSLLLSSQSLSNLLSVPSALSVLHTLALKCVLHEKVSEGVEHYLDLLAALHSEEQHRGSLTIPTYVVHAEAPPLPGLPELYLEAGAALLMARRPTDCMTLCEEVINMTSELLPEKLILEEPEDKCETETGALCPEEQGLDQDRLGMLLWVGAAHLLCGHCQSHLKDWKEAVTHYTRCINLLVKVHVKKKDLQTQTTCADVADRRGMNLFTLQRLKGLSLAGRGISFTQRDQLRVALRDLQLSLQALPECVGAGLWRGEVLWRLGRRREAAACWEKTWSFSTESSSVSLPLYLQEPQSGPSLDFTDLRHRIEELTHK